jgi:nucleotide-binding universal stress UspA family protein
MSFAPMAATFIEILIGSAKEILNPAIYTGAMRILIAVSGTDDGTDTVAFAAAFPWPRESALRALTVGEKVHPSVAELMAGGLDVADVQQTSDARAGTIAASSAAKLQDRGWNADSISLEGDPKSLIVEHAKDWGADLIVIGSSDKSTLERFLLGSVSQAVVTRAHCSVLVVKSGSTQEHG